MMAGMVVVRDGQPWTVARISDTGPSIAAPRQTVYYLQHGTTLETLESPKAKDVPLLPRCPNCGPGQDPGQAGSPGWPCSPSCDYTQAERAALLGA